MKIRHSKKNNSNKFKWYDSNLIVQKRSVRNYNTGNVEKTEIRLYYLHLKCNIRFSKKC